MMVHMKKRKFRDCDMAVFKYLKGQLRKAE
jgi:hypothetical protein